MTAPTPWPVRTGGTAPGPHPAGRCSRSAQRGKGRRCGPRRAACGTSGSASRRSGSPARPHSVSCASGGSCSSTGRTASIAAAAAGWSRSIISITPAPPIAPRATGGVTMGHRADPPHAHGDPREPRRRRAERDPARNHAGQPRHRTGTDPDRDAHVVTAEPPTSGMTHSAPLYFGACHTIAAQLAAAFHALSTSTRLDRSACSASAQRSHDDQSMCSRIASSTLARRMFGSSASSSQQRRP